nr:methylesterase 10 isoform X2 [Solanum lycopersicum]
MEKIGGIKSFNMEKIPKKHFILVHGFCHGSWCWYKIINLLEKCGHKVTALDLGGCGINMKQLNEIDSIFDYIQPLMDLMISLSKDEKIILVSHSYGGLCISLAMEAFPHKISTGVFISAYMPNHVDPPSLLILEVPTVVRTFPPRNHRRLQTILGFIRDFRVDIVPSQLKKKKSIKKINSTLELDD